MPTLEQASNSSKPGTQGFLIDLNARVGAEEHSRMDPYEVAQNAC